MAFGKLYEREFFTNVDNVSQTKFKFLPIAPELT